MTIANSKSEKKMKKEIAKLKEANTKILDTAEQQFSSLLSLEKENAELRSVIEGLQDGDNMGGIDGSFKDSLDKAQARMLAEKARAEEAVAREAKLRTEIAQMRLNQQQNNGGSSRTLMSQQPISEHEANEIASLQYEIERLSTELLVAKEEARNTDTFSADDMMRKYDELKRLAESGMQKDLEIEKLKMRVNTQDAELNSLREEVTEEDLKFGVREYADCEEDIAAAQNTGLRSLNDELSKQLELYKKDSDDAKTRLSEERTRSEMEMKAFSVALKGVDDLRIAAENMSRELHFIKTHGYVPPGGLTGTDASGHVQSAMSAVESMAVASQSIDHPALNDQSSVAQRERGRDGFNLWNAMNAVMGPGQVQAMQNVSESTGGLFNGNSSVARKGSSKHKSGKKKKKGSGGSVISSFF
mmetsp:Transcript_25016/g.40710  ORF Transcript_25016/g.40710 Transcript_25016/m.40710 type:complete len:416 (-) Transcript_25016:52-1299(-)